MSRIVISLFLIVILGLVFLPKISKAAELAVNSVPGTGQENSPCKFPQACTITFSGNPGVQTCDGTWQPDPNNQDQLTCQWVQGGNGSCDTCAPAPANPPVGPSCQFMQGCDAGRGPNSGVQVCDGTEQPDPTNPSQSYCQLAAGGNCDPKCVANPAGCYLDDPRAGGSCSADGGIHQCCQYAGRPHRTCNVRVDQQCYYDNTPPTKVNLGVATPPNLGGPTAPAPKSGNITITPNIKDLDPTTQADPKPPVVVTVTGLNANQQYAWVISKVDSYNLTPTGFHGLTNAFRHYSQLSKNCFDSGGEGKIENNLGPFVIPGFYKLEIYQAKDDCQLDGGAKASRDFSVGGPTGAYCCSPNSQYRPNNDSCFKLINSDPVPGAIILPVILPGLFSTPSLCSTAHTYCEPASVECFKSQTLTGAEGKICQLVDTGPNSVFDPARKIGTDKYIICASSGGIPCGTPDNPAVSTAIGCIHTNPAEFAKDILKFAIGIGGGLAFLMMILGAFQMLTSQGNPETLNAGKQRLTSAIIGLLIVIFAVLLLQIIGFGILNLPGFGK